MKFFLREHWIFTCIIALFLLLRFSLLFTSQSHLDADEAVVGLMAKHIMERGEHPVFFYGLPYNGGASVEAHLAALLSIPFGINCVTVKASAFFLSIALLFITYLFCLRYLGKTAANIASLLLITAEPLIAWNLKARGGYLETMIFSILIPLVAFRIFYQREKSLRIYAILGFLCGCALWCQEMSLSILAAIFLFWLLLDKAFFFRMSFGVFLFFFALGNLPSIYFNFTHSFLNWKDMFLLLPSPGPLTGQVAEPQAFSFSGFLTYAAGFFDTVHGGYESWPVDPGAQSVYAWTYFGVIIAGVPLGLYFLQRKTLIWRVFLYCLVFFFFHILAVHLASHRTAHIYRYYLPLFPLLNVFLAIILTTLGEIKWRGLIVSFVFLAALAGHGLIKNIEFVGKKAEESTPDIEIREGIVKLIPVKTRGESILETIDFLRSQGIRSVFTSPFIKYRLIFESREEIKASSSVISLFYDPYFYYDRLVREDRTGPFAFVFFDVSTDNSVLLRLLKRKNVSWKRKSIHGLLIYYPFTRPELEGIFQRTSAESFFAGKFP